jgi:hypothetical protein
MCVKPSAASLEKIAGREFMLEHLPMSKLEATTILELTDPQYRAAVIQGKKHDLSVLRALKVAKTLRLT